MPHYVDFSRDSDEFMPANSDTFTKGEEFFNWFQIAHDFKVNKNLVLEQSAKALPPK